MTDLPQLDAVIDDLKTQASELDYTQEMTDFLPELASYEAGMFAGEFDSSLVDWEPLRPSTIKRKGHDRRLFDMGALRDSLVHIGGSGNIAEAFPHGLIFGTDIEYAGYLQDGTSRMPARPPVGISEETIDKLCEVVADATVDKLTQ